jgi:hypothetical protein
VIVRGKEEVKDATEAEEGKYDDDEDEEERDEEAEEGVCWYAGADRGRDRGRDAREGSGPNTSSPSNTGTGI